MPLMALIVLTPLSWSQMFAIFFGFLAKEEVLLESLPKASVSVIIPSKKKRSPQNRLLLFFFSGLKSFTVQKASEGEGRVGFLLLEVFIHL